MDAVVLFLAATLYVGLRAAQQINVVKGRFLAIWPVSLGMAATDIFVVSSIVAHGWSAVLPLGLGGATGCTISMALNAYFNHRSQCHKIRQGQNIFLKS